MKNWFDYAFFEWSTSIVGIVQVEVRIRVHHEIMFVKKLPLT